MQVPRVSTVISHTETRRENAIENSKNAIQVRDRVWVWTRKKAMWRTQRENLELQTLKTHRNSNQMIHRAQ